MADSVVFGSVRDVELDSRGRVYVLDSQAQTLMVFSPDGHLDTELGGPGPGPGEFSRDVTGLTLGIGDVAWVADRLYDRFVAFDSSGDLVDTYPKRYSANWSFQWGGVALNDSLLVDPTTMSGESGESHHVTLVMRPSADGMVAIDTVPQPAALDREFWEVGYRRSPEGPMVGGRWPIPFQPERRTAVGRTGTVWLGRTDSLRFVATGLTGDTLRIIERRPVPARTVTSEDRRKLRSELAAQFGSVQDVDWSLVPEGKPLWSTFFEDDVGRLWVSIPTEEGPQKHSRWDIFLTDGDYLGTVSVPIGEELVPSVRNGRMAGVTTDGLGVQTVVILSLY